MSDACREARRKLKDTKFEEGVIPFFPIDRLRGFFRVQTIRKILFCTCTTCQEDLSMFKTRPNRDADVNHIVGGKSGSDNLAATSYLVFGLLLYIEHPSLIFGFLDYNCSDSFMESWVTHSSSLFSQDTLKKCTGAYCVKNPEGFERLAKDFMEEIRHFSIPHMNSDRFVQYHSTVVLPFEKEREIGRKMDEDGYWTSEGANGKVFAFQIYAPYNKFTMFEKVSSRTEFARKQIETPQPQAFLERSNIEYVQKFGDDHIVKLIKAYGHGESINLIFPKAWTNLDHLLRNPEFRYNEKRGATLELADGWRQMLGIARALKKIQGYSDGADDRGSSAIDDQLCIHFDLKPDNILIEKEGGNWVVTDFGQAALTRRRRGITPRVGGHWGTDAYAPPEIEDTRMGFGRSYDIWSLGCIMLEVTSFLVSGYAGLKGNDDLMGLDQARRAMPMWTRSRDERFFYQEYPQGEYVVKKEIVEYMDRLKARHATSLESSEESNLFLDKILDLIKRMLKIDVRDRVDICRVVQILSSALERARTPSSEPNNHQVKAAKSETVIGGPELNRIALWYYSPQIAEFHAVNLEILQNEAGFMRLHCWTHGREPTDISFRRSDVKVLPLYAFWDPNNTYYSRTWLDLLCLSSDYPSEVANAKFSFDGSAGLKDARFVQSTLTNQRIVGSFALASLKLTKPTTIQTAVKGLFRKMIASERTAPLEHSTRSMEFGSATIQIWAEQKDQVEEEKLRKKTAATQAMTNTRAVRVSNVLHQRVLPRRVVIYLHQAKFICTIRVDLNWVTSETEVDQTKIIFKPHPPGRNRCFHASWIRPTQEELDADCPAGIPIHPGVLAYYEDRDSFEIEAFEIKFLNPEVREHFQRKYQEIKKEWYEEYLSSENRKPVNRAPESPLEPPEGVGLPPFPHRKASFPPGTRDRALQASGSRTGSRHDSTVESLGDVRYITAPEIRVPQN